MNQRTAAELTTDSRKKKVRNWIKSDIIPVPERTWEQPDWLNKKEWSPVDLFELFYDSEVFDLLVETSMKYAVFKGNTKFHVSLCEMKTFIAILLLSGYCGNARYRLYWDTGIDTHHQGVARAISRNRFEEILRYFHVSDNNNLIKSDKFSKVRPLWAMINERWLTSFPKMRTCASMKPWFRTMVVTPRNNTYMGNQYVLVSRYGPFALDWATLYKRNRTRELLLGTKCQILVWVDQ